MIVTEELKVGTCVTVDGNTDVATVVGYHRRWVYPDFSPRYLKLFVVVEFFYSGEDGVCSEKSIVDPVKLSVFVE